MSFEFSVVFRDMLSGLLWGHGVGRFSTNGYGVWI